MLSIVLYLISDNKLDRKPKMSHLLYNLEAIAVIPVEDIGSHERKDRHNIMQHRFLRQSSEGSHEQQCLIERMWVSGD